MCLQTENFQVKYVFRQVVGTVINFGDKGIWLIFQRFSVIMHWRCVMNVCTLTTCHTQYDYLMVSRGGYIPIASRTSILVLMSPQRYRSLSWI